LFYIANHLLYKLNLGKSIPIFLSKFFGMNLYIDKLDYNINHINNKYIDNEINAIEDKLAEIEENAHHFALALSKKLRNDTQANPLLKIGTEESNQLRLRNITKQILILQLKIFAESIICIKKDVRRNLYQLNFDVDDFDSTLILNQANYSYLMKFRDLKSVNSVFDKHYKMKKIIK